MACFYIKNPDFMPMSTRTKSSQPVTAMILAAGRGERMRPLSDHTPKPLLKIHGKPMIEWHLEKLAAAGIKDVVINTCWLEEQFLDVLGNGKRWGLNIHYSMEQRLFGAPQGTAGGIIHVLDQLEKFGDAFWLISGDIYAPDFEFSPEVTQTFLGSDALARLWVIPNPPYHPEGDFGISDKGLGIARHPGADGKLWTYASIALMRPALYAGLPANIETSFIQPLLDNMDKGLIEVQPYTGRFENVGTPEQLELVNGTNTD